MKPTLVRLALLVMWLPLIWIMCVIDLCESIIYRCERIRDVRWAHRLVDFGERFAKRHGVDL